MARRVTYENRLATEICCEQVFGRFISTIQFDDDGTQKAVPCYELKEVKDDS